LFRKTLTILIVPQDGTKVKRVIVPKFLTYFIILIFVSFIAYSAVTTYQYRGQDDRSAELERLRQKAVKQNIQIHAFSDHIRLLQKEMDKLTQYNKKLTERASIPEELQALTSLALGGSSSETTGLASRSPARQEALIRKLHFDLDSLLTRASFLEQNQHKLDKHFEDARSILVSSPTLRPVNGYITSGFGYRFHPLTGKKEFHKGLDVRASRDSPIISPANGIVLSTRRNAGYGRMVVVDHGYGIVTRYGHVSKVFVKPGQRVKRGEKLAAVGSTGRTTGPHLHYEVIRNGIAVNPIRYLARR
jgi:murein DD-endopeptidase MepM/ murein hydrolase activator NlpD